jgi:pyruvate formate lyase activating enzyme
VEAGGDERGIVLNIQYYSIHDGPGIRTTVFLKGCPFSCPWCANPESLRVAPEVGWREDRCKRCGLCVEKCPHAALDPGRDYLVDHALCDGCGACVDACPHEALCLFGRRMSAGELLGEVAKDRVFYRRSGGGVTVSGGEPTLQSRFLCSFLDGCRGQGFHTAMETNGHAPWETFQVLADRVDLFLYDLKIADPERHRAACGQTSTLALANLRRLAALQDTRLWLRIAVIPGYNDDSDNLEALRALVGEVREIAGERVEQLNLMPYHALGKSKYTSLDRDYALADVRPPAAAEMERLVGLFSTQGLPVFTGG